MQKPMTSKTSKTQTPQAMSVAKNRPPSFWRRDPPLFSFFFLVVSFSFFRSWFKSTQPSFAFGTRIELAAACSWATCVLLSAKGSSACVTQAQQAHAASSFFAETMAWPTGVALLLSCQEKWSKKDQVSLRKRPRYSWKSTVIEIDVHVFVLLVLPFFSGGCWVISILFRAWTCTRMRGWQQNPSSWAMTMRIFPLQANEPFSSARHGGKREEKFISYMKNQHSVSRWNHLLHSHPNPALRTTTAFRSHIEAVHRLGPCSSRFQARFPAKQNAWMGPPTTHPLGRVSFHQEGTLAKRHVDVALEVL